MDGDDLLAIEVERRGQGPSITRAVAIPGAAFPGRPLARLREDGWCSTVVLVLSGDLAIRQLPCLRASAAEQAEAARLTLEAEGLLPPGVKVAWQQSKNGETAPSLAAVAWHDTGLSALQQAVTGAGFRVAAAFHTAFCSAALASRLSGRPETWALHVDRSGAGLTLANEGRAVQVRRLEAPEREEAAAELASEVRRTLLARGASALQPPLYIFAGGQRAAGLQEALEPEVRAFIETPRHWFDGSVPDDCGRFAPLIGASLAALGLGDAGPDFLTSLPEKAAAVGEGRWLLPMLAGILIFALMGGYFVLARAQKEQTAANAWLKARAGAYRSAEAKLNQCNTLEARVALLESARNGSPAYLEALRALDLSLPPGAHITGLILDGTEVVELSILAPQASTVMRALQKSPAFAGLAFKGSITLREDSGIRMEQFTVGGRLAGAKEGTP